MPRRLALALALAGVALGAGAGCGLLGGGGGSDGTAPRPRGPITAAAGDANARAAMQTAEARHDSLAAAHAPVPEFPDAAPRDLQLPSDVLEALKGSADSWTFAWRVDLVTFRLDQLARSWTRPLPDDREPWDGNADGEDLRLTFLAMPGPSGTTALDPYGEWSLVQDREIVHARRALAPSVSYIDLSTRERRRVLVLPDRFARIDGALWIDASRFLVFAGERLEPNPWSGGPVLYLVDLGHGSVTRFAGPAGDYPGYQAVGRELDRRFRKQLSSVVFDGA